MKLYFIRHGRQDSTLCNVNVPLSEAGKMQAELVGARLENYGIGRLYSSNLIRAVETAEIINKHLQVEHTVLDGLQEIDFGALTGLSDGQIKKIYGEFFRERDKYEEDLAFPEGENGRQVYERAKEAIYCILHHAASQRIEKAAVVTHGGTIRSILAGVVHMPQQYRFFYARTMENTSITQINYDRKSDRFFIERINDYAHLEGHPELLRKYFK